MKRFCFLLICALFVSVGASAQTTSDYDILVQKGKTQLQAGTADLALASGEAAIKMNPDRWEGYALAGGALMNLKRYEDAADKFSKAIERAPEAKQAALRGLRRQSLTAEPGGPLAAKDPATTTQAEIVLWKSIENSNNLADFQSYLDQYPHGAFVVLAQRRLAEAKAQAEQGREEQKLHARQERDGLIATSIWPDPSTGLTWTKSPGAPMSSSQAPSYCGNLNVLGYAGWRLPTIDELKGIYDSRRNGHIHDADILLTPTFCGWAANSDGKVKLFSFGVGKTSGYMHCGTVDRGALCVYPGTIK
jgi:tetratricopeptide (TPR) repeat protein